jgi:hypothetical protein
MPALSSLLVLGGRVRLLAHGLASLHDLIDE